jgi:hypothetical protein
LSEDAYRRMAEELTLIRVALGRVSVYEGLVDVSPTASLVDDLVRDHEELEARIDAALHLVYSTMWPEIEENDRHGYADPAAILRTTLDRIAQLLRGARRVPDSPEGLTED